MKWFVVFSILFAGHIPAFRTALTTYDFLSLFDFVSIFLGWLIALTFLECWNVREIRTRILTPDEIRELLGRMK